MITQSLNGNIFRFTVILDNFDETVPDNPIADK